MKNFNIEDYRLFLDIYESIPSGKRPSDYVLNAIKDLQDLEKQKFIKYKDFVDQTIDKCYVHRDLNNSYDLIRVKKAIVRNTDKDSFDVVDAERLILKQLDYNYFVEYDDNYTDRLWINRIYEIEPNFFNIILQFSLKECKRAYKYAEFAYKESITKYSEKYCNEDKIKNK